MRNANFLVALLALVAAAPITAANSADNIPWTLESAVTRAIEVAPERRAAEAEVGVRAGRLAQVRAFPNPTFEVRADQKLGIEDGRGGADLTQYALTQPLPLARRGRERRQAEASLTAAREQLRYQNLLLEQRTAHAYHALQLATARRELAEARQRFADEIAGGRSSNKRDALVRYLSPLERTRLAILHEQAAQESASAEGTYSEAVSNLGVLLGLAPGAVPEVVPLATVPAPTPLATLESNLTSHPLIEAMRREADAAKAGVDVARSRRFADPTVTVFRERDFLANNRETYSGVQLGVQVPLWGTNSGGVASARAEVNRTNADLDARQRELASRLRQSHLHLGHLIEQAAHYEQSLLKPSERLFDLARKSFRAGEQNVLTLVDANNTWFEAQARYRELLHDAWREAADLRLATGVSVVGGDRP